MLRFKKFFSKEAIILYLLVIILSGVSIIVIDGNSYRLTLFSIIINVVTILGFLITINQIIGWKEVEDEKNREIREELKKYSKAIIAQDFLQKSHVVESAINNATNEFWQDCLKDLNIVLKLLDELEVLNNSYQLNLELTQISEFRLNTNLNCQYIENNLRYTGKKIKSMSITQNMREISSVIHKNTIKIKASL